MISRAERIFFSLNNKNKTRTITEMKKATTWRWKKLISAGLGMNSSLPRVLLRNIQMFSACKNAEIICTTHDLRRISGTVYSKNAFLFSDGTGKNSCLNLCDIFRSNSAYPSFIHFSFPLCTNSGNSKCQLIQCPAMGESKKRHDSHSVIRINLN